MNNKKEAPISVSLGTYSNYINKMYLNNRATIPSPGLQQCSSISDMSRSKQKSKQKPKNNVSLVSDRKQVQQSSNNNTHRQTSKTSRYALINANKNRVTSRENTENRDKSNVVSRENSSCKESLHDDINGQEKRKDNKSFRKLQLSQKGGRKQSNKLKCTNISLLQWDDNQRPHQSQNLRDVNQKSTTEIHRKLYTFCDQSKNNGLDKTSQLAGVPFNKKQFSINQTQTQISSGKPVANSDGKDSGIYSRQFQSGNETIVVKQQELKRFTQKFAREKIEYEESLNALFKQNQLLANKNQLLKQQLQDYDRRLILSQNQEQTLKQNLMEFGHQISKLTNQFTQYREGAESIFQQKNEHIKQIQQQLNCKQSKIAELLSLCQRRNNDLHQLQRSNAYYYEPPQHFLMPLSNININHAMSINTSLSHESPSKLSLQLLQELEYLRRQHRKSDSQQTESQQLLAYYKIENEHMTKQLQLEKQNVQELKLEIDQIREQLHNKNEYQQNEPAGQLHTQISQLLQQIEQLKCNKQTLQRSLKVSSQMIINLKTENTRLKYESQCAPIKTNQSQNSCQLVPFNQVQHIILSLMKQHLQLEDKLNESITIQPPISHRNNQVNGFKAVKLLQSDLNLQRKYQQGYQSIKRRQKKCKQTGRQNCKTEQNQEPSSNSRGDRRKLATESDNWEQSICDGYKITSEWHELDSKSKLSQI